MKRLFIPVCLLVLASSCKEVGPVINFTPAAADTSFKAATETAQSRMVLMEEFTGVTCSNCPEGHDIIKSLEASNPGRLVSIGIQIKNFPQCNPVDHPALAPDVVTRSDNRTEDGTALASGIYSTVSFMPAAGVDRMSFSGTKLSDRTKWTAQVADRLAISTPVNIKLSSTYNTDTRTAIIKVHVAYTGTVAKGQSLTVALMENEIIDAQEYPNKYVQDYRHEHVLRDIITAPTGEDILQKVTSKEAGQVYERTLVYKVPAEGANWNMANCQLVAYVANREGSDVEVQQAAVAALQ